LLHPADLVLVPFSLFWLGFVLVWEYYAITGGAPVCFPILGFPFVLLGLYMLAGRFFVDAARRSRTYYGLTDRRGIILSGLGGRNVESLDLEHLSRIHLASGRCGRGTITFGSAPTGLWGQVPMSWLSFGRDGIPRFERIENAGAVYEQIVEARRSLMPDGGTKVRRA
jgi:hypothetical protein